MRKDILFVAAALLMTQQAFADTSSTMTPATETDAMTASSIATQSCDTIAKACISANYNRNGAPGKAFWMDCMKPVLLGQNVTGVTIASTDVTACRAIKVKELQQELEDLQKPMTTTSSAQ